MDIHIFIISWAGQHENAIQICKQVIKSSNKATLIYSDPNPEMDFDLDCTIIRRPNELFWGDKFKSCLEHAEKSPILVIHADCQYSNWPALIQSCQNSTQKIPSIGVWSPLIDYVPWKMQTMLIANIADSPLRVVTRTDAIVFYLASPIVQRMKLANYDTNLYGWGIEWMFVCAAYAQGMITVIDSSIKVQHPNNTGYPKAEAQLQLTEFLKQLSMREEIQGRLLRSHIKLKGGTPIIPSAASQ
jgi:hypothetical protein